MSSVNNSLSSRVIGLATIIFTAPLTLLFGLIAAYFLMQEFLNGWIPSRWVSDSGWDWIFGTGTQGGARNYFGFMLSALPAGMFGKATAWGYAKFTPPKK
jgi:hypothetical protein